MAAITEIGELSEFLVEIFMRPQHAPVQQKKKTRTELKLRRGTKIGLRRLLFNL